MQLFMLCTLPPAPLSCSSAPSSLSRFLFFYVDVLLPINNNKLPFFIMMFMILTHALIVKHPGIINGFTLQM
jgi:hypothetical protein